MTPAPPPAPRLLDGPGPMDSPFLAAIAAGLAQQGWRVVRFEFAYMARMRETAESPAWPLFIGGKSMGGRVASLLVEELAALRTPTLILQGERDSFGRREEVQTYSLSPAVQLGWLPSGDHSFKPTRSAGLSEAETWVTAVAWSDRFLRGVLGG